MFLDEESTSRLNAHELNENSMTMANITMDSKNADTANMMAMYEE